MNLVDVVNKDHANAAVEKIPNFRAGDTLAVHAKITEGNKTRVQIFQGMCIGIKSFGDINGHFKVRKMSSGMGVERVFLSILQTLKRLKLSSVVKLVALNFII